MGSFADYLENEVLKHLFGKATYTAPSHIYLGLSTADPTDDGSGIAEPSGGSYARKETSPGDWNAAVLGTRILDNAGDLVWPAATADWGTIGWFFGSDAASGGNILFHGELLSGGNPAHQTITTGDTFTAPAGIIDVKFTAGKCSNYLAKKLLDHVFGKASYSAPSNYYLALSTANPGDDGSGLAEPTTGSYARKSSATGDYTAVSGGSLSNANLLAFVTATADWAGPLTHGAILDAATSGNLLCYNALTIQKTVNNGNTFKYPVGQLVVSLS